MSTAMKRTPAEETVDLYPGLAVHDDRQGGSITIGRSRLPIWAVPLAFALEENWQYARDEYGVGDEQLAEFARHLLEARGEFARLLLVLADAERQAGSKISADWLEQPALRAQVAEQLRLCLEAVETAGRA